MAKLCELVSCLPEGWTESAQREELRARKRAKVQARHERKVAFRAKRDSRREERKMLAEGNNYALCMLELERTSARKLCCNFAGTSVRKRVKEHAGGKCLDVKTMGRRVDAYTVIVCKSRVW